MKQNIQQLIIAATIILAAGNNCAVAQSNSTAISSSETNSTSSPSPRLSLRSNLLLWAFGSPSLGMDLTLGRRWQVGLDGSYGNWSLSHRTHAARLSTAGLQLRRYFRPFTNRNSASHPNLDIYISSSRGVYLGIDLRYTHFNEQLLTAGTPGREGDLISAGILLGYSFALDPCGRWAIDAALALGYQYQDYDRYTWYAPAAQNRLLGTRTHNRFTLTALDVALVYRF